MSTGQKNIKITINGNFCHELTNNQIIIYVLHNIPNRDYKLKIPNFKL